MKLSEITLIGCTACMMWLIYTTLIIWHFCSWSSHHRRVLKQIQFLWQFSSSTKQSQANCRNYKCWDYTYINFVQITLHDVLIPFNKHIKLCVNYTLFTTCTYLQYILVSCMVQYQLSWVRFLFQRKAEEQMTRFSSTCFETLSVLSLLDCWLD